jgi:hypothetical protein
MTGFKSFLVSSMFVLVTLCVISGIIFEIYSTYHNPRVETVVVNEKSIKLNKTKEIEYLIYTDNGVYEISDQLFMLKFNSSDIYSSISIGDTITIKVSGARVHVMSTYPNIISVIHTN